MLAEAPLPVVVDGDALWELEPGDWPAPRVLTPHSAELGRLIGEEARGSTRTVWRRLAGRSTGSGASSCSKATGSLIAAPGKGVLVDGGHPSLATAGTGDVLTGIVAAFLAKGWTLASRPRPRRPLITGRRWRRRYEAGLIASDLLDALPTVLAG